MEIRRPQPKAPLVSNTPLVTQFDLAADDMTYGLLDTGMLVSSEARGSFHTQPNSTVPRHGLAKYEAALQSFVNTITPTGIVIHHTALIASGMLPRGEKDVDEYHKQRGFEIYCFGQVYHVAYHYLILPDGTVQNGRPEHCEGAHARGYNSYLGISIIGDFSSRDNSKPKDTPEKPTAKQLKALVELCRMLRRNTTFLSGTSFDTAILPVPTVQVTGFPSINFYGTFKLEKAAQRCNDVQPDHSCISDVRCAVLRLCTGASPQHTNRTVV